MHLGCPTNDLISSLKSISVKNHTKRKLFDERRNKLRAKFDRSHVCPDCIEEINTGKRTVKIGMN